MLAVGEHDIIVSSVVQSGVWQRYRVSLYSYESNQEFFTIFSRRSKISVVEEEKIQFQLKKSKYLYLRILKKKGKKSRRHVWLAWVDEEEVEEKVGKLRSNFIIPLKYKSLNIK